VALPGGPPRHLGLRQPSPAVLFDVEKNGETIKGIGAPGKTGWLYLLDRETGKPLYGIDEKPVTAYVTQDITNKK